MACHFACSTTGKVEVRFLFDNAPQCAVYNGEVRVPKMITDPQHSQCKQAFPTRPVCCCRSKPGSGDRGFSLPSPASLVTRRLRRAFAIVIHGLGPPCSSLGLTAIMLRPRTSGSWPSRGAQILRWRQLDEVSGGRLNLGICSAAGSIKIFSHGGHLSPY